MVNRRTFLKIAGLSPLVGLLKAGPADEPFTLTMEMLLETKKHLDRQQEDNWAEREKCMIDATVFGSECHITRSDGTIKHIPIESVFAAQNPDMDYLTSNLAHIQGRESPPKPRKQNLGSMVG